MPFRCVFLKTVAKTETKVEPKSDMELICGYLNGKMEDFDTLYYRYQAVVYGYLMQQLAQSDADDIFQQTWLRVLQKLPGYDDRNKFAAWVLRIAHNLMIDRFRREKKFMANCELEEVWECPEMAGERSSPLRALEQQEFSVALKDALTELTDSQREVFVLRNRGLSFKEISEIQQCSINTALARMQYAVKNLQKRLSHWGHLGGKA